MPAAPRGTGAGEITMKFTKQFSDGYSLTPDRAAEMKIRWAAFQRAARKEGKRAQLNYHGVGEFSFDSFPQSRDQGQEK
jgi:hypothetical protein